MLDYLYQRAIEFEKQHGIKPNILYLNNQHLSVFQQLLTITAESANFLSEYDVNVVVCHSIAHPAVSHVYQVSQDSAEPTSMLIQAA